MDELNDQTRHTDAVPSSTPERTQRIVVGVDASEGSRLALDWALAEASLRGAAVHVVLAWQYHPSWTDAGLGSMFPLDYRIDARSAQGVPGDLAADVGIDTSGTDGMGRNWRDAEAVVAGVLDDAIGRAQAVAHDYPVVLLTQAVVEGHPAQVLVDASGDADLLVVGSRGHGQLAGTLLGSISQHVACHSRCPVVIVPLPIPEVRAERPAVADAAADPGEVSRAPRTSPAPRYSGGHAGEDRAPVTTMTAAPVGEPAPNPDGPVDRYLLTDYTLQPAPHLHRPDVTTTGVMWPSQSLR